MRYLTAAAALLALTATCAPAAITAFWVPVPITPAAINEDPALQHMQTWDLRVTTDGNWGVAGLQAVLPAGNGFYKHPNAGNTRPNPLLLPVFPAIEFTTHVTAPADTGASGAPVVLGSFPEGEPASLGDPTSTVPGTFSVSWGDDILDPPGTYQIARLTFPASVVPNVINIDDVGPGGLWSRTIQLDPDSTVEIPDIPEPTSLVLVTAASLLAFRPASYAGRARRQERLHSRRRDAGT